MCKTDSTRAPVEIKPVVQRPSDRIDPAHAAVIQSGHAVNLLNHTFHTLIAMNAVAQVLMAHGIGDDCGQPIIAGNIEGGLIDALVCLSDYAAGEIEFFADRAHTEYEKLNSREANRG